MAWHPSRLVVSKKLPFLPWLCGGVRKKGSACMHLPSLPLHHHQKKHDAPACIINLF